jgi:NADP-dependent 3-hydroxy acid dehydrogenase YdfG
MSQRLKDKVILVTGSTTGIGEGMVRREGHDPWKTERCGAKVGC